MAQQIEKIVWTRQSLSLSMLAEKYKGNSSPLVIVQQGYLGEVDIETFSKDQVMKIHGLARQDRVVATDSRIHDLSIPVNYPFEFEVLDQTGSAIKRARLSEILKSNNLPLNVQFAQDRNRKFYSGNSIKQTRDFGTLKLKRIYTEKYLMGNFINEGVMDGRVVIVPMYVDIRVAVATGFGPSKASEWKTFETILNAAQAEFDFQNVSGYKEITLYNAGSSDDYGTIKPKEIVRMSLNDRPLEEKRTFPKIHLEKRLPVEAPPPRPRRKKYIKKVNEVTEIVWPEKQYGLKDFYEKFCDKLPKLIIVRGGYYGQTELDTIAMDEVIRIQTYSQQKRVIAQDKNGHYLSIPITFRVKMQIVDRKGKLSSPRTLEDIIETSDLPIKVCFVESESRFTYAGKKSDTYNMGELELEDTYDETYFLGNGVYLGEMGEKVTIVPVYLPITVSIAETFKPGIRLDWEHFLTFLATGASFVNYDIPAPNQNIAMYSPDQVRVGDNTYEYIEPKNYVSYTGTDEPDSPCGDYTEPTECYDSTSDFSGTRGRMYYAAIPGEEANTYTAPSGGRDRNSPSVPGGVKVLPVPRPSRNTPALPPRPAGLKKSTSLDIPSETSPPVKHHYENSIGRATVSPIQRGAPKQPPTRDRPPETLKPISYEETGKSLRAVNNPYRALPSVTKKTRKRFMSASEVPSDISELTVDDVGECLDMLNLQGHRAAFKKLQVDGSLLQIFNAKIFQEDDNFKMSVAEALKLEKFLKGWRPKE